jgi:hypothetical protein
MPDRLGPPSAPQWPGGPPRSSPCAPFVRLADQMLSGLGRRSRRFRRLPRGRRRRSHTCRCLAGGGRVFVTSRICSQNLESSPMRQFVAGCHFGPMIAAEPQGAPARVSALCGGADWPRRPQERRPDDAGRLRPASSFRLGRGRRGRLSVSLPIMPMRWSPARTRSWLSTTRLCRGRIRLGLRRNTPRL